MHNLSSDIYSNRQFIYFHKAVLYITLLTVPEISVQAVQNKFKALG